MRLKWGDSFYFRLRIKTIKQEAASPVVGDPAPFLEDKHMKKKIIITTIAVVLALGSVATGAAFYHGTHKESSTEDNLYVKNTEVSTDEKNPDVNTSEVSKDEDNSDVDTSKKPTDKKDSDVNTSKESTDKKTTEQATTQKGSDKKSTTEKSTTAKTTEKTTTQKTTQASTPKSTTQQSTQKATTQPATQAPTERATTQPSTQKATTQPSTQKPTTQPATQAPTEKATTQPATEKTTECNHNWVWATKTVHHDMVYHKEPIYDEGWAEPVYITVINCSECGKDYADENGLDHYENYCKNDFCMGSYSEQRRIVDYIEHEPEIIGYKNVIDAEAYDEEVNDYQYCSICGKRK